jgi:hypothetical protein
VNHNNHSKPIGVHWLKLDRQGCLLAGLQVIISRDQLPRILRHPPVKAHWLEPQYHRDGDRLLVLLPD